MAILTILVMVLGFSAASLVLMFIARGIFDVIWDAIMKGNK